MTITLTREQEEFVSSCVRDGLGASPDEVVAEALSILEKREVEEFLDAMERRSVEADQTPGLRSDEVIARYKAKAAARRAGLG